MVRLWIAAYDDPSVTESVLEARFNHCPVLESHCQPSLTSAGPNTTSPLCAGYSTGDSQNNVLMGRRINPRRIDTEILKCWIAKEGRSIHGAAMSRPPQNRYFRFIDLHNECVIQAPPSPRYVALSYVWGLVKTISLTRQTMDSLQKPSGLGDQVPLPRTILDAMHLCKELDERYLYTTTSRCRGYSLSVRLAEYALLESQMLNTPGTLMTFSKLISRFQSALKAPFKCRRYSIHRTCMSFGPAPRFSTSRGSNTMPLLSGRCSPSFTPIRRLVSSAEYYWTLTGGLGSLTCWSLSYWVARPHWPICSSRRSAESHIACRFLTGRKMTQATL